MSEKIQPSHIEREACVYIRQSTMQQVRTRLEGQRRQYDLRERAQVLGFQRVVVIDEDQGRSGTGSVERPGFGRLLAAVCSGKVGAVLAFEASRLARNNRDWHHLIDLCAMAGTPSLGKNLSDSWRIQKCSSAVAPFYAVLSAKVNIETA